MDTYKAVVADAALRAGAHWINDVWGLRADELGAVAAHWNAGLILMHDNPKPNQVEIQSQLGGRYIGVEYQNLVAEIREELLESVSLAQAADVANERIILDPGIGFGKNGGAKPRTYRPPG